MPEHAASAEGSTLDARSRTARCSRPERARIATPTRSPRSTPLAQVTAIRLEVLADDRFPHHGPGRQDNGNLHLSEIQVFAGDVHGKQLPIATAAADFNQDGWGDRTGHRRRRRDRLGHLSASRPNAHGRVRTERQIRGRRRIAAHGRIEAIARRRAFDRPRAAFGDRCRASRSAWSCCRATLRRSSQKPAAQRTDRRTRGAGPVSTATQVVLHDLAALAEAVARVMPRPAISSPTAGMCRRMVCGRSKCCIAATFSSRVVRPCPGRSRACRRSSRDSSWRIPTMKANAARRLPIG